MFADAALIVIALEVPVVSFPSDDFSVYVPAALSVKFPNEATPETAATLNVLPAAKLPGPDARLIETVEESLVTTLP